MPGGKTDDRNINISLGGRLWRNASVICIEAVSSKIKRGTSRDHTIRSTETDREILALSSCGAGNRRKKEILFRFLQI